MSDDGYGRSNSFRGRGGPRGGRSNYSNIKREDDGWNDDVSSGRFGDQNDHKGYGGSSRGESSGSGRYSTNENDGEDYCGYSASSYGRSDDGPRRGGGRGINRREGRNDSGFGGGNRNRRDDDNAGSGYRNRRNDDENGSGEYRGRRDDYSGGGYRNRRDGDDNDDDEGRGRGRGRGGGRGRGRDFEGGRREDGDNKDENNEEKPKERYIPPDPTDDEDTMFGSGITSGINFSKYENIRVQVSGENPLQPIRSFEEAGLRSLIEENVKKSGYKTPTPIQKYALPIGMSGRDMMACAQTGSGKTAAYLIPIINTLLDSPSDLIITSNSVEPQAVIMSPTRELTIQIFNEARKFAHASILKVALVYGGTATFHQANILMRGCHILVATPGRLNDFVSRGRISFASVRFFVLDEADRMLDMGFKPEIEKMLLHETMVPVGQRQTMMFSATFPGAIQSMAQNYLHNYLFVAVGIVGGACADVEQIFFQVSRYDKKDKLKEILSQGGDKEKTLVFVEQKRNADFIAALLSESGFPTTSIHGDRFQSQREMALNDFKTGRMPTLVATAVAARGLDIKNVTHVVNFDLPNSIEEYVHRIGRTGRVGNRGRATSFFDPNQDAALINPLVTILKQTNQEVPDFLTQAMDGGGFSRNDEYGKLSDGQGFGGRDVRKGGFGSSSNYSEVPVAQANIEEEEW